MKDYSAEVAGIDTEAITSSVSAGKDLVKMASEIPGDGLFGTDGIDDFGTNVVKFGQCMKKYGKEVADVDSGAITSSVAAAKGLVSVANQIPDDGTFGSDGIDDFGKNIVSFAKSLKKYSDAIVEVSISSITSSATAVRSLISLINSTAGIDTSGVASFKKAIADLSSTNIDGLVRTFSVSASKLANVGKNMFESIIRGAESTKAKFTNTIKTILNTAITTAEKLGSKFKSAGTKSIDMLIDGVRSGKAKATQAFTTILNSALSAINGLRSSFYSAGANLAIGFANGISANSYMAAAKAQAMAAAAAAAARAALLINSPSKVGYEIGDFFGLGFVNAIADSAKRAYDASTEMADSAKTGLMNAFDRVSRIISGEIDVQPTIRPVIDLTNVRSGANAISGMLGLQPSMSVLTNIGAVSSMMNNRGQNGTADEVVAAINRLRRDIGNMGNTTYNVNGVTYDDGSNVSTAVEELARAIRIERRT